MAVKLKKPIEVPLPNGDSLASPQPIPLKPLAVSAVVVTKAALIGALRVYLNLVDLEVVEDGQRFILTLGAIPDDPPSDPLNG